MADIYDSLNPEQKKGVFTTEGPVLLLAGAGSGKTRVLVHRVAYLINEVGVNPWNILAITFTNKAAGEMRERVDDMVGFGADDIWVATFHATCARILRRYIDKIGYETNFTIYDTDDSKAVIREICKRLQIDTKMIKERAIMSAISSAKDELISPIEFEMNAMGDYTKQKYAAVYREYQDTLQKNNALDFDDMICKTVELLKSCPEVLEQYQKRFRYIMVDEYQDTNTAQFELIRLLAAGTRNLCVVGDDDQSIYKFRGANIRNILDFEQVYPDATIIKLEQNYRSTGNILDAANSVIRNNSRRKGKALWTQEDAGNAIHYRQFDNAYEEAEYIADDIYRKAREDKSVYGETAVLYRTNAQSRLLEERFVVEGIPYNVVGGVNFYSRKEIKDILAYLKTIDNAKDDMAVKRIINVPKRGIGATTIVKVQDYADEHDVSFYDALKSAEQITTIGKSSAKLYPFVNMIQSFRSKLEYYGLEDLVKDILTETKYLEDLGASDDEDAADRIANIDEFISKVVAYEESHDDPKLSEFLEEVALVSDIDNISEIDKRVLLMTVHAAKGLEFENVYLSGMEDGVFPSYMTISAEDPTELEEERRLAYVAITRAKKELTITSAKQRMIRGETNYNPVSRFVKEIPVELMDNKPQQPKQRFDASEPDYYTKTVIAGNPHSIGGRANVGDLYGITQSMPKATPTARAVAKPIGRSAAKASGVLESMKGISKGMPVMSGGLDYVVGDRVKHMKYGAGTVLQIEAGAKDYQVTVSFDDYGNKVMYAAFAKLVKI